MGWFLVIEKATGRLLSQGSVIGSSLPKTLEIREIEGPSPDGQMWDNQSRSFVPRPPKIADDRFKRTLVEMNFKSKWRAMPEEKRGVLVESIRTALMEGGERPKK